MEDTEKVREHTWSGSEDNHLAFSSMARNAFDVMMQRGWSPKKYKDQSWGVQDNHGYFPRGLLGWSCLDASNPFSPLVEADQWLKGSGS